MDAREDIAARLRACGERLPGYAPAYRALPRRDFDHVYPLVLGYIRDRFLLTPAMCVSDKLLDLADVSLRYMLELKRMGIDPGQISRSCSGASSVISKKVLLMKPERGRAAALTFHRCGGIFPRWKRTFTAIHSSIWTTPPPPRCPGR